MLLEHAADQSLPNWNGVASFAMAAMRGHIGVVGCVRGADPDAVSRQVEMMLHVRSRRAQSIDSAARERVIRWLLSIGAWWSVGGGWAQSALLPQG